MIDPVLKLSQEDKDRLIQQIQEQFDQFKKVIQAGGVYSIDLRQVHDAIREHNKTVGYRFTGRAMNLYWGYDVPILKMISDAAEFTPPFNRIEHA